MLGTILKIALAVSLIGIILAQTSIAELITLLRKISLPWLLGGVLAFYATIWTMARRYWLLVDRSIPFSEFLSLVIVQTVVGSLVATSAGALSYIALLRSKHQIAIHQGLASLVISRLGDVLALLIALLCSSWAIWPHIIVLHWLVGVLIAGLTSILLIVALIVVLRQRFVSLIEHISHLLHLDRLHIIKKITKVLSDITQRDTPITSYQTSIFMSYSALTLIFMFIFAYCNTQMFGVPIGAWSVLFMLVLAQITVLIPIQVFGGLGIYDITNLYLYSLFGFEQTQMAAVIIGIRLIFYLINALVFLYVPIQGWLQHRTQQQIKPS